MNFSSIQKVFRAGIFLLPLLFLTNRLDAQFSVVPQAQCYSPTNNYTVNAGLFVGIPGATDYTYSINGGTTSVCVPSYTPGQHGALTPAANGSQIAITSTCCGIFTITLFPFNSTVNPGTPVLIGAGIQSATFQIFCPSSGIASVSQNTVCIGNQVIWTGTGGANPNSYTWTSTVGTPTTQVGNGFAMTPSINTCMAYTATTAQGCTIAAPPTCVTVQAITASVSPASQTICAGSPICLTATAQAVSNASVGAGTATTGVTWLGPGGGAVNNCTTNAAAGTYSAIITHTGVAGTCNYTATAVVVTSNSISVNATASSPSVCPNATVQLNATSVQTAAASYTWIAQQTFPPGSTVAITGNPITRNNNLATASTPQVYTVNVNYFGCPGSATVSVGMLQLTPTLTPSSFSICPGTQMSLSATGGSLYTFRIIDPLVGGSGTLIGAFNSATNTRTFTPAINPTFSISVSTNSNGCTGTQTVTIDQRVLSPTIIPSSASVCPNSQFTLTALNAGNPSLPGSASFTWSSGYSANLTSPSRTLVHTPPLTAPLPQVYTVTADSAGCRGTATYTMSTLVLHPTLTPSSYSICQGTAMTLTISGGMDTKDTLYGSPLTPPPGSIIATGVSPGPAGTTLTFTPNNLPANYVVRVDSAGCQGTNTLTIGILGLGAQVSLTPTSYSMCPNTVVTLTASTASGPNSYNFTFVAPVTGTLPLTTQNTAQHNYPGVPTTYSVYADSSTCTGFTTITISKRILNPTISASNTFVCSCMAVTVAAQGVGTGPMTTYTFGIISPNPAPLPSGGPSFSFAVDNPCQQTVYTVKVDSAGCTNDILNPPTVTVTMRPNLQLTPSASAASVCPGTAATLAVTGPTYVTWPISYTWTQTGGSGSVQPTPPIGVDSIFVYPFTPSTYSVSALDSLGCTGSTVISVGIDPTISFPVALSSSGSTICPGQSVTLTATSTITTVGSPSLTYIWVPASTLSAANNSTIHVAPLIHTTYTVQVSNQYGCTSGNTITVPVGQMPVLTIAKTSDSVCPGFTSTLTAFGANSYTWGLPNSTVTVPQQSLAAGPGTYSLTGSNGGSCVTGTLTTIGALQPNVFMPITVIASSPTTCIESNFPRFSKPVKLTASASAQNFVWFPYNPNNMTYSLGATTDVRPSASTQYTVIASSAICANTAVVNVTVIPQFTMSVVPPLPAMCFGDSLKLSITNIYTGPNGGAVGPVSAWTYSWTEPGNAPPISLNNNLTSTVMAFPQNTSTYSVEVRDSRKCVSLPRLVTVTVLPRPLTSIAVPTINSVATRTICYVGLNPGEKNVTLDLQAVNQNTALQFGVVPTYTWMAPYTTKYNSILTPSNSAGITISAPVKLPSVVIYTVVSGYNGIPGCRRVDTVSIRVIDCRPIRAVQWTTTETNDTICARTCITFQNLTDTMAGGPQKLVWQFPGGSPNTSTLSIPTICYNLPGKYNVILTAANQYPTTQSGGSSMTIGQLGYIKVVDVPNVMIVPPGQERSDTTIRLGTSVSLQGSGANTYEWAPNYNITSLTNPKTTVNPYRTTQYILTGYNSSKCMSSDTINVIVIEDCGEMYVPNAFSPNNDGANDVLYVRGICLQSLTFMVFDRWGEKVFETTDQRVGWDGSYKGEACNTGVFVYRLEGKTYDGKGFSLKGNITLIR